MKFNKWIELRFGYEGKENEMTDAFNIAKECGMKVPRCYKMDMQTGFNILMIGSRSQWEAVKATWAAKGIYPVRKKRYWM